MKKLVLAFFIGALVASAVPALAATRPDPGLTPGAVQPGAAARCDTAGASSVAIVGVNPVAAAKVFRRYHVAKKRQNAFSIDVLVPAELGGDLKFKNLWPIAKDQVATKAAAVEAVRAQVCAGAVTLADAQSWFEDDWTSASAKAEQARIVKKAADDKAAEDAFRASLKAAADRDAFLKGLADAAAREQAARDAATAAAAAAAAAEAARRSAPTGCPNGTYVNTAGNTVCSPYASSSAPAGATAQCRDGTYSFSQSRSGTCSSHGGVATWL